MEPYDNALKTILAKGTWRSNKRTGVRCKSHLGIVSRYRINKEFPILSRRKVWPKAIFAELLWFISGSTCNKDLQALGANIWTPWVDAEFEKKHGYAEGCFGPVYGFQLRHFGGTYGNGIGGRAFSKDTTVKTIEECNSGGCVWDEEKDWGSEYGRGGFDQLAWMMNRIKEDPSCRRILFSLWNPKDVDKMKLPPCHYTYQLFIDDDGRLSGMLTQRSCDFPIGVPANIQFYSALTCMIAQQTGYEPYEFVHSTVDSHIYENQIDEVEQYLSLPIVDSPKLTINKAADIFSYSMEDFILEDYNPGPVIKFALAV
jgi:thymidylate synthase